MTADVDVDMNIDVDDNIVVCSDNDYLIDCVIIDLGKLTFTLVLCLCAIDVLSKSEIRRTGCPIRVELI